MALIVDKHRPRSLDQLTYHDDLSNRLRSLVGLPISPITLSIHLTQYMLTMATISRHNPATSPISFSTDLPVRVKKLA